MEYEFAPFALVVDDDGLIRMDAVDILEEAGFRTYEAADVAAAITIPETNADHIELLFTDVQMPGGRSGFDLARECAQRWPEISILVASGQAVPDDGDMPGNATFVRKPFSADVVYDRLQELLPDGRKPTPLNTRFASPTS